MDPTLISAGVSAIGSLLGSGAARGARKKAAGYSLAGQKYANGVAALLPRYNNLAQTNEANFNQFAPQARDATQGYADYLESDPYTDTVDTAYLNNATAGATTDYKAAAARSAVTLARRGITGSNVGAGAALYNDNALAANTAAARNALAMRKIQERGQRKSALMQLLTGAADNSENGVQENLGRIGQTNMSLSQYYQNLAAQQEAQAAQSAAGTSSMFGQLGDLAAVLGSRGKKKGFSPLDANLSTLPRPVYS